MLSGVATSRRLRCQVKLLATCRGTAPQTHQGSSPKLRRAGYISAHSVLSTHPHAFGAVLQRLQSVSPAPAVHSTSKELVQLVIALGRIVGVKLENTSIDVLQHE